ncbi:hydrogenase formation protein HypD [Caldanaerobius polysaccharolyticus]|uniref:hydrogenase formation protein HypD n=1 Tax=Caldanaerobius polysaccharolyticus TaxID=44256 RepID=UPI00068FE3ED|nr:hydrogenase formation protein HypD [Caldanaerobius polysaccharolyticus]
MKKINVEFIRQIRRKIEQLNPGIPIVFMEVCGTHTMSIARAGIRQMLPDNIRMISGPGCPVCVTSARDIDYAISFASLPDVILTTFGDMVRVPGSQTSLSQMRARGCDVRVVYSVYDALDMALENPSKQVVFEGVGFETTAPSVADAIMRAKKENIKNFSVLSLHKTVPEALKALLNLGEVKIDGFLLPGHVSAIIGVKPYEFLPAQYGVGGVISGFQPEDILLSIAAMLKQLKDGPKIQNQYSRVVREEGNVEALKAMEEVFEPCDARWRGIGVIRGSGLIIKPEYAEFDATKRFDLKVPDSEEPAGCRCGDVLRGVIEPEQCPLFARRCTPDTPVGPCMVSSEGSCGIWYSERSHKRVDEI